jgi:hypothetical protein
MPANVHENPKKKCAASAISPAVTNVPSTPREAISTSEARKAPPADLHPAVEEDRNQSDDADPLDLADRSVPGERGKEVGRERRGKQEDRRTGEREALGQLARGKREREASGDEEDNPPKLEELAHVEG